MRWPTHFWNPVSDTYEFVFIYKAIFISGVFIKPLTQQSFYQVCYIYKSVQGQRDNIGIRVLPLHAFNPDLGTCTACGPQSTAISDPWTETEGVSDHWWVGSLVVVITDIHSQKWKFKVNPPNHNSILRVYFSMW